MNRWIPGAVALLFAACASAEITSQAEQGFVVEHELVVAAGRTDAWQAAVGGIGSWWSSDHTISGDAGNLRIEARALGCFCERLSAQGEAVHLLVTFVNPGVLLRMTGGLGPLGLMGTNGNMTWEFFEAGDDTRIRFTYAVGGYHPDGLDSIAPGVDFVIGEALARLGALIETGAPEPVEP